MTTDLKDGLDFAKLSGAGNDFMCIDNRDGRLDKFIASGRVAQFARTVCRRGLYVGADGVIFLGRTDANGAGVDTEARFFEPDGAEAELCGNGTGCFVYWVVAKGWAPDREIHILTAAGVARAQRTEANRVKVCIPTPEDRQTDIELDVKGSPWTLDYMVTGVPHAITYVDDVDDLDIDRWGPAIRHHERFGPRGVNANFVQVLGEGRIAVRTFEFGVEHETMACGTGCSAAAISSALRFRWPAKYAGGDEPILVRVRSGDELRVWFTRDDGDVVRDVCLETVVRYVYDGRLRPELLAIALDPASREKLSPGDAFARNAVERKAGK